MRIPFWKMHGAGNDFILVDDREQTFPALDRDWMARCSARRTGVGCDGIILVQPSGEADFRMRFFNPDGAEAEMCGNGARCVARLARELGAAPQSMRIETMAGTLRAETCGERVRLHMTPPGDWRTGAALSLDGRTLNYDFVNTGVPHVVVEAEDLDGTDVAGLGAAIRYHGDFAPAGTNVNFVAMTGADALRVRTYERGVEAETLACGTGICAAALTAARNGRVRPPVCVRPTGGDRLTVAFRLTEDSAEDVVLEGPTVHVFHGTLEYEPARS